MSTKVNLCGIEMDNPVIPASGTFGFGKEFAELYDINIQRRWPAKSRCGSRYCSRTAGNKGILP